jgi:hypothetical protein
MSNSPFKIVGGIIGPLAGGGGVIDTGGINTGGAINTNPNAIDNRASAVVTETSVNPYGVGLSKPQLARDAVAGGMQALSLQDREGMLDALGVKKATSGFIDASEFGRAEAGGKDLVAQARGENSINYEAGSYAERSRRAQARLFGNRSRAFSLEGQAANEQRAADKRQRMLAGDFSGNALVGMTQGTRDYMTGTGQFSQPAQTAMGNIYGSLFARQGSIGSALAKRACKYKNKK